MKYKLRKRKIILKNGTIFSGILLSIIYVLSSNAQQDNDPLIKGPYLGQKPPGVAPEIFAPGIVSTDFYNHCSPTISPDGKEIYWAMSPLDEMRQVYLSKSRNGCWTKPEVVSFTHEENGDCPVLSPDGKRLYFNSSRPRYPGDTERERIWYAERQEEDWSIPKPLGSAINDEHLHWQISVDKDYNLYFGSERQGSKGKDDVFFAEYKNGKYSKPVSLGSEINTEAHESCPYISPDGSFLIFCRIARERLLISYKQQGGKWTKAKNMGNEFAEAICPYVSPDKKYLFFLEMGRGYNDVYWVSARIIEDLKLKKLK